MEYITRQEKYLAYLAQLKTGKLPAPQTREEIYLAAIAGLYKKPLPYPQTRVETYLKAIADGKTTGLPEPKTRKEYYLYAIATDDTQRYIPTPITREEQLLDKVVNILVGVEDVTVSGNGSAMLYNAANHGFTGLTLYGKSTQENTTGSNILKDNYLSLCKGSIDLFAANGLFTVNANYEKNAEFNLTFPTESIFDDSIKDEETYYIVFRPIGFKPAYKFQLSLKNGAGETTTTSVGAIVASVSGTVLKKTARIQLYFYNVSGAIPIVSGSKFQMIFSKKPDCIYEPYTGGKPSPSPEYPQEIKSAGQDGEIGVEVLGGNLFDKSAAYDLTQSGGWSAGFDGEEIKVVGNNVTIGSIRLFRYHKTLPAGTYTFSISKPLPFTIRIDKYFIIKKGETSATVTFDNGVSMSHFAVGAELGTTFNEQRFKIMLNIGSTALPYELYKPAQKLIVPTSGGLPGIPVSSGGNYTDEKGQQWVADEIDLAKGERVKWIGEYELTGKENVADFGLRPSVRIVSIIIPDIYIDAGNHGSLKAVMSNKYKQTSFSNLTSNINLIARGQQNNICISIPTDIGIEDFKTDLSNQYASGRPVKVFYKLGTPIRTPLPPETIAAYKTLRTYSPTTTVINDAEADMKITYRCNLKKTESELEALYVDTQREFKAIAETEDKE